VCFNVDLLLKAKDHDRIIVSNDPVNYFDPWGLNPALLIQAENFVLIHGPEIVEAADSLMPHMPANHYVGQIYSAAPEITNGLIQANQTLGQCILDSAEYLAMDAGHDIINKAIPAVLDGIANEWNRATTPKPPFPKPVPSFTQGPLK